MQKIRWERGIDLTAGVFDQIAVFEMGENLGSIGSGPGSRGALQFPQPLRELLITKYIRGSAPEIASEKWPPELMAQRCNRDVLYRTVKLENVVNDSWGFPV